MTLSVFAVLAALSALGLPNPVLTPGVIRPLTLKVVCETRWSLDHRHVPEKMKKQIAAAYGVPWAKHNLYEFDHKIAREIGGADAIANIYPQCCRQGNRIIGPAHLKDVAENHTHAAVCDGRITLDEAQRQMAKDWTVLYRRFVGELPKVVE